MDWSKKAFIFTSGFIFFATGPALASEVILDLTGIANTEAKTAPPVPGKPQLREIEIRPQDVLVVHCPAKSFPGTKGWIEYHASLNGPGCLVQTTRQEAHVEAFQATGPGTQKIIVGLKQPGATTIEKDCLVTVKVTPSVAQSESSPISPNVQSYAGQQVFGNKTAASRVNDSIHTPSVKGYSQLAGAGKNNVTPHSVEEQSKSTVKTYDSNSFK